MSVATKSVARGKAHKLPATMLAAVYRGEGWAVMGTFKTIDEDGGFIAPNKLEIDVRMKNVSELADDELEAIVAAKGGG